MGTAKTKELMNYLLEYIPANPTARIYILTFRITFGKDLQAKMNAFLQQHGLDQRFVYYKDVKSHQIDENYLIIQTESLNRLKMPDRLGWRCGLLIMDESESIYE